MLHEIVKKILQNAFLGWNGQQIVRYGKFLTAAGVVNKVVHSFVRRQRLVRD